MSNNSSKTLCHCSFFLFLPKEIQHGISLASMSSWLIFTVPGADMVEGICALALPDGCVGGW